MLEASVPPNAVSVFFKLHARVGAALAIAIGLLALCGWVFDIAVLKSIFPNFASMKVNTAICFMALGSALLCVSETAPGSRCFYVGRALAACVIALTVLTLSEYIFGWELGIDEAVIRNSLNSEKLQHPGRMTPAAATNFLLLALSMFGINAPRSFLSEHIGWLMLPVNFSATMAVLTYVYEVKSLYEMSFFASMALHTALLFWVLSVCVYTQDCSRGYKEVLASDTTSGKAARRLIPISVATIIGLSLLRRWGERTGIYSADFGLALMISIVLTILIYAVVRITRTLYRSDIERLRADAEIIALNATLEQRVAERTRDLQKSLAEVNQLSGLLPICSYCKKIRDDQDYWHSVENYVTARSPTRFSHGICPSCIPRARAEMGLKPLPG